MHCRSWNPAARPSFGVPTTQIDEVLDVGQQARFRVLEEQLERKRGRKPGEGGERAAGEG